MRYEGIQVPPTFHKDMYLGFQQFDSSSVGSEILDSNGKTSNHNKIGNGYILHLYAKYHPL